MYDVHSLNKQTFYISCKGSDPYSVFTPSWRDSIYSRLKFFLSIGGGGGGGGQFALDLFSYMYIRIYKKGLTINREIASPIPGSSMLLHVHVILLFFRVIKTKVRAQTVIRLSNKLLLLFLCWRVDCKKCSLQDPPIK